MVRTKDPRGRWSDPVWVVSAKAMYRILRLHSGIALTERNGFASRTIPSLTKRKPLPASQVNGSVQSSDSTATASLRRTTEDGCR